jgi:hypothetical protein
MFERKQKQVNEITDFFKPGVTVELLRPLSGVEFVDEASEDVPLFRFERVNDESSK